MNVLYDLAGFVRTLDEIGARSPLGVEVLSDDLVRRPVDEVAQATFGAMQGVLRAAWG